MSGKKRFMFTLYVSPYGNDKNDGSAMKPFRTVEKALRVYKKLWKLYDVNVIWLIARIGIPCIKFEKDTHE